MEAIDSIKIVQVDGLTNGGKIASPGAVGAGGSGNLATDAVSAALAYRAQAPVLDGLMKELGLDGSSLDSLVRGPVAAEAAPRFAEALTDAGDADETSGGETSGGGARPRATAKETETGKPAAGGAKAESTRDKKVENDRAGA